MPISVSLVDENAALRRDLATLLDNASSTCCLKAYATGEEAVAGIPQARPDVVLMDVKLPGMNGIECLSRIKAQMPYVDVLMLTREDEIRVVIDALSAGASGYLLKDSSPTDLVRAIEEVHAGGAPLSMRIARKVVGQFHQPAKSTNGDQLARLTRRELEALELLAQGCLYKEIGDQLGISMSTVRAHLHGIYRKLRVESRTEAVVRYLEWRSHPSNRPASGHKVAARALAGLMHD